MVKEKTAFGVLHKNLAGELHHVSFSKEYPTLARKEEDIVMYLIDNDYEILDKKGNRLIMDDKDMWDYDACLENATQDIDATLE